MAKIAKVLQPHIDTAFPANVCLLGSVLPNGFAQITPRGGTMVFDDEHIGLWEPGTGSSADAMEDGSKLTIYSASRHCAKRVYCPAAASPAFTAPRRSTKPDPYMTRCGGGGSSPKRSATRKKRATRC